MSTFVQIRYLFSVASGGELVEFAQSFVVPVVELDSPPVKYQVPIAASGTATLWSAAASFPATFKVLAITADQNVRVEFTAADGDAQEVIWTENLRAGGFPLTKFSDVSYKNLGPGGNGLTGGTVAAITKIRALNLSATAAVMVTVFIGT